MRKDCILSLGKDFQISPNKTPVFLQGDRDVEKFFLVKKRCCI